MKTTYSDRYPVLSGTTCDPAFFANEKEWCYIIEDRETALDVISVLEQYVLATADDWEAKNEAEGRKG